MPSLPNNLAAVRRAVASILRLDVHVGNLYNVNDIAYALRVSADIRGDPEIGIDIDSHLVLRAFAFDGRASYTLPYDSVFG